MSISRGPSVVGGGDGNPIGAIVGLAAIGVSIWGLVCAAGVTIAAVSLLLRGLSQGIGATIVTNVILGGIAGLFAAVATEIVRQGSDALPSTVVTLSLLCFRDGLENLHSIPSSGVEL